MSILLLEDEKSPDNAKLSQIIHQLKETDVELTYTTYEGSLESLKKGNYNFTGILVIATIPTINTKRIVATIMKNLMDNDIKQIPFAVISGIFIIETSISRHDGTK